MRILVIAAVILFALLPLDAQMALIGFVRPLWLSGDGRAVLLGMIGAAIVGLPIYALGWNGLAAQMYHEDRTKAETAYRSRRR